MHSASRGASIAAGMVTPIIPLNTIVDEPQENQRGNKGRLADKHKKNRCTKSNSIGQEDIGYEGQTIIHCCSV
jgi:hypothetical protein